MIPADAEELNVRIYRDGDKWCAVLDDFVDLQQSPAGFGDTRTEAVTNLCEGDLDLQ